MKQRRLPWRECLVSGAANVGNCFLPHLRTVYFVHNHMRSNEHFDCQSIQKTRRIGWTKISAHSPDVAPRPRRLRPESPWNFLFSRWQHWSLLDWNRVAVKMSHATRNASMRVFRKLFWTPCAFRLPADYFSVFQFEVTGLFFPEVFCDA